MALFSFRTRNPERDRQTDARRFQNLKQAIRDALAETERERDGFRRRYDDASVDAAFSFENIENEGATERTLAQVDNLTQALTRFSQRIDLLEKQTLFMREIDEAITRFENANGIGQMDPKSD
ncbi:MAG: hypothetical protein AAAB35_00205 [Phyllobacterium sp.]|uniref:hypothetical protein n=1 Tax=Phyllobacterium sp. TaxID=1871046 RepID=UPI0030F02DFC